VYAFKIQSDQVYLIVRDYNDHNPVRDFKQYRCKLEIYISHVCNFNFNNMNEQDIINFTTFYKYQPAYEWYIEVKRVHDEDGMTLGEGLYLYNDRVI
jgi:hypothetical protein